MELTTSQMIFRSTVACMAIWTIPWGVVIALTWNDVKSRYLFKGTWFGGLFVMFMILMIMSLYGQGW